MSKNVFVGLFFAILLAMLVGMVVTTLRDARTTKPDDAVAAPTSKAVAAPKEDLPSDDDLVFERGHYLIRKDGVMTIYYEATDADMAVLDRFPQVKEIDLAPGVVAGSLPGRGSFIYFVSYKLTDKSLARIGNCPNLERLELRGGRDPLKLSDNAFANLKNPKLAVIDLGNNRFTKQGLAPLAKLPALTDVIALSSEEADLREVLADSKSILRINGKEFKGEGALKANGG